MAYLIEEVLGLYARVYKWNQKYDNIDVYPPVSRSQGHFNLRVKSEIKRVSQTKEGYITNAKHDTSIEQKDTIKFDYKTLRDKDSMECWLRLAIPTTKLFPLEIIPKLARDISNYLFSCFRFNNINNQTSSKKPVIVINVHVSMLRIACIHSMLSVPTHSSNKEDETDGGVVINNQKCAYVNGNSNEIEFRVCKTDDEEIVVGTLNLVQAAVKVKRFDGDESVDDNDKCSICLERFKRDFIIAMTPCSHVFHRDCVFQWLPNTGQCPMCRSSYKTLFWTISESVAEVEAVEAVAAASAETVAEVEAVAASV
ncbi:hypothetical protein TEA_028669 [Camellia sinensis var. sinensis]|uniref:RING-type domain-containing protein n=1 Tax=Camellia sinensis var. sinensis TaxID=542762 RepID=A0A4S4EW67_CAMSN|nr:hypothetical protein TEA_028669 [Camellia sinensis var. sinensis]